MPDDVSVQLRRIHFDSIPARIEAEACPPNAPRVVEPSIAAGSIGAHLVSVSLVKYPSHTRSRFLDLGSLSGASTTADALGIVVTLFSRLILPPAGSESSNKRFPD